MSPITVDHPKETTRTMVRAALQNTDGIDQYHVDGDRIVAKSPPDLISHGEQVTVDLRESAADETEITLSSSKELPTSIMSDPEKYEARFLEELDHVRDAGYEEAREVITDARANGRSREVRDARDLRNGTLVAILSVLFISISAGLLVYLI